MEMLEVNIHDYELDLLVNYRPGTVSDLLCRLDVYRGDDFEGCRSDSGVGLSTVCP